MFLLITFQIYVWPPLPPIASYLRKLASLWNDGAYAGRTALKSGKPLEAHSAFARPRDSQLLN